MGNFRRGRGGKRVHDNGEVVEVILSAFLSCKSSAACRTSGEGKPARVNE